MTLLKSADISILIGVPEKNSTIDGQIKSDVQRFLTEAINDPIDLKILEIASINYQDLINRLKSCYGL